ncbi:hypothetical protein [Ancylomarina sp. 16SWW S1-10-2]|uniref:hypothetical protein n=1 Tax=Ancylomarina sp. 16SWW S1-10-2 TaxID=2499681 RepID=UPI0012AD4B87|nr:hypothetical protein [Ancylomarina sp. 16SWW S1-10-2]MRT94533.1 hypothetical protein [Ancylomarina sp. 16SWW S1-10-2]
MLKGTLHRILIIVIFTMVALASAKAQSPHVILPGSTHKLTITNHVGNTYEWKVYKVNDWADEKDALLANNDGLDGDDDFLFVGGEFEKAEVEITFLNEGKYFAIAEEFNSGTNFCSSRRAIPIEVLGTNATIAFKDLTSSDCPDGDTSFAAVLIAEIDIGIDLPETNYPLTVTYRITGETEDRTATITAADKLFHIEGIIEDITTETNNTITIVSAKNKYGGKLNVVSGQNIHTRTIYKQPVITAIEMN